MADIVKMGRPQIKASSTPTSSHYSDPFREVKSKLDKKKESKDSTESRSRSGSNTSSRGRGMDRYARRGGSTQFSSSDSGALHGKVAYIKDHGTNPYTSSSSTALGVAEHRTFQRPTASSDFVTDEKKSSSLMVDGNSLASQPSTGYQPAWVGARGQKSMADIVKMGRPQIKASSTPTSSHYSGDHGTKVPNLYVEPGAAPDEWPVIEPPQASMASVFESHTDTQLHSDKSRVPSDKTNLQTHSEPEEVEAEEDSSVENLGHVVSATVSTRNLQVDNFGDASLTNNDMYEKNDSYQSHHHAFQIEEVEDVKASVSSETANMHQLSIQEDDHEVAYEEDIPSVVIPNHLQVQSADCSHLSFGSFGSALTGYSDPFASRSSRSNMEETHLETDAPAIGHSDTRNSEYYRDDEAIRSAADANLVHRTSGDAAGFDSPSAPQEELLKQEHSEVSHGNQYAFPSSSTGYTFENAQQLNGMNSSCNYSQTSTQMQNITPFSSSMVSSKGTTIVALIYRHGIIVASDSRGSRDIGTPEDPRVWIVDDEVTKIYKLGDHMVCTVDGNIKDCDDTIVKLANLIYLHNISDEFHVRNEIQPSAHFASSTMLDIYKKEFLVKKDLNCGTIIASCDKEGPIIYYLDSDGFLRLRGILFTQGSGGSYAHSYLQSWYYYDMSTDYAAALALASINYAARYDSFTGGIATGIRILVWRTMLQVIQQFARMAG